MKRDDIDFHAVRFEHEAIHERLCNWARYVSSRRGGSDCAPMFRGYRSSDIWADVSPKIPVDTLDGHAVEKAVAALPEKHMQAVRWAYVYSRNGMALGKACRLMGVRQDTLHRLIEDGRSMLLRNRSA